MITMAQQPEDIFARMSAKPIIPKVDPHETLTAPIGPPPPTPDLPISMSTGPAPDVSTGMAAPRVNSPASLPGIKARTEDRLMADYKKDADPYGSPDNHPGFFGKFLHGLNVATGGVNRRQFEEQGLENRLGDLSKLESSQNLQGAQGEEARARADALQHPQPKPVETKWKPLLGGNDETITAPNGNIVEADDQGNLRAVALPEGATVTPKPTTEPHDAFHEWLSDPQKFEEFLKAQTSGKATAAKGFGAFAGVYALPKTLDALREIYRYNPALGPYLGPVFASVLNNYGIKMPEGAGAALGRVPEGQPENDQGHPIGTAMPEAPTAGTRGRGQFAESVLPTIASAERDIQTLGADLGPLQGRWLQFFQGKVGADNPKYAGLSTSLHNIATAWMRLHANSDQARQEFEHALRTSQTPADLIASLNSLESQAKDYVKEGKGRPDQLPGNHPGGFHVPEGAPAAPKEDGKYLYSDGKAVAKSENGKWVKP